jgi:hypothetical protein
METLKHQRKSGRKRKVKHKMSTIKERKTFARLLVMLLPLSWKLPVPSGTFEEGRGGGGSRSVKAGEQRKGKG